MAVKRTEEGLNPGRRSTAQRRTAALECDAKMRARSHDTAKSFQKSSHSLYNSRIAGTPSSVIAAKNGRFRPPPQLFYCELLTLSFSRKRSSKRAVFGVG